MYFALYRTTIDASSSPHVGIVCLWCHWPSTASSTATVLTSRALDNSHINHMIASSIELPSCPRHDLGVSPSCYCHLNRIFRSTKHDIRASMYDKIGFCPLWLRFHFCMLLRNTWHWTNEIWVNAHPKNRYIKSIVLFYMVANDPNFMSFSKISFKKHDHCLSLRFENKDFNLTNFDRFIYLSFRVMRTHALKSRSIIEAWSKHEAKSCVRTRHAAK